MKRRRRSDKLRERVDRAWARAQRDLAEALHEAARRLEAERSPSPHPRDCTCRDYGFLNRDCPIHGKPPYHESRDHD